MQTAPFEYYRPESVAEAIDLLSSVDGARPLSSELRLLEPARESQAAMRDAEALVEFTEESMFWDEPEREEYGRYGNPGERVAERKLAALEGGEPVRWKPLAARGVFVGRGSAPKTAFLFTGQGSQYVNMLAELRSTEPVANEVPASDFSFFGKLLFTFSITP